VQRLAVNRYEELRPRPSQHIAQLVAARMPRYVDEMGAVGDDLDPLGHETVDDGADRLLVARNGARREDHAVALVKRYFGMIVVGDTRQRGARFALAPGAER